MHLSESLIKMISDFDQEHWYPNIVLNMGLKDLVLSKLDGEKVRNWKLRGIGLHGVGLKNLEGVR